VPNELGRAIQEIQRRQLKHWQQLYLKTIEMSDDELRAALKSKNAEQRCVAAYVVGERRLPWHNDLIPLLDDAFDTVRQAARRSLVILSFLALNPEEARLIGAARPSDPPTPLANLVPPVDFGPKVGSLKEHRLQAVRRWTEWWEKQSGDPSETSEKKAPTLRANDAAGAIGPEPRRLANELAHAESDRQRALVAQYRDAKGGAYSEAMALAIRQLSGDQRAELREALAIRMARLTDETLGRYLDDSNAEIRRAAILGLAMRESQTYLRRMIEMLLDPEPAVQRATYAGLRELTKQDFGPALNATEAEVRGSIERWLAWTKGRGK